MTTESDGASAPEPVRPAIQPRDGWSIAAPSGALARLFCETPGECAAIVARMERGLDLLSDGFRIVPVRLALRDDEAEATDAYRAIAKQSGGHVSC